MFIKTSIPAHLGRAGRPGQPILTPQGLTVAKMGLVVLARCKEQKSVVLRVRMDLGLKLWPDF